ncbi:MAG: SsrA-binding protein SmpB [Candidatus Gastranaerophilales bacterium]|nr:SsrA-binding protein SmpB [Candidatus Gastranaerophilales bacterium]
MGKKIISTNRKAFHEYHIFDKFNAGVVLTGTEIKSIRKGAVNLKDSFVKLDNGEVFLYNCHISPYEQGNRYNHEEKRTRKLLLNKKEIDKLSGKIKKDGYAIVPLEIYLENGWAKIEIALAKGKKLYDKREDLAKKTQSRDIARIVKSKNF